MAEHGELGEVVAEFTGEGAKYKLVLYCVTMPGLVVCAAPFLFLSFGGTQALPFPVRAILSLVSLALPLGTIILITGLAFLYASIMLPVHAVRARRLRVQVRRDGLVEVRGGDSRAFRWDEITTVRDHRSLLQRDLITFCTRPWVECTFGSIFPPFYELRDVIRQETKRHLLPAAVKAYEVGETVDFGRLQCSRSGITIGTKTLAWGHVAGLRVTEDRRLLIDQVGRSQPWGWGSVSLLFNVHVLLALAEHARATCQPLPGVGKKDAADVGSGAQPAGLKAGPRPAPQKAPRTRRVPDAYSQPWQRALDRGLERVRWVFYVLIAVVILILVISLGAALLVK
jgi:hypothetical protein